MPETPRTKSTAILWFVAAALALIAALLNYSESGTWRWPLLAAAFFLAAMGVSTVRRR
jgi:ABC-type Co2+ transport system permease subunit